MAIAAGISVGVAYVAAEYFRWLRGEPGEVGVIEPPNHWYVFAVAVVGNEVQLARYHRDAGFNDEHDEQLDTYSLPKCQLKETTTLRPGRLIHPEVADPRQWAILEPDGLWSLEGKRIKEELEFDLPEDAFIHNQQWSPDGRWFVSTLAVPRYPPRGAPKSASTEYDHQLFLWHLSQKTGLGAKTTARKMAIGRIDHLVFSRDSRKLMYSSDGTVLILSLDDPLAKPVPLFDRHVNASGFAEQIDDMTVQKSGDLLAVAFHSDTDCRIEVWDFKQKRLRTKFASGQESWIEVEFVAGDDMLITGGPNVQRQFTFNRDYPYVSLDRPNFDLLKAWDVNSGRCLWSKKSDSQIISLTTVPGTDYFVFRDQYDLFRFNATIHLWKAR